MIQLEFMKVTEQAALASYQHLGRGNKELADKAATDAIRSAFRKIPFCGKIVTGEGEKDKSFGLFTNEIVGGEIRTPDYDIAVDPIEGTTAVSSYLCGGMSVIALSEPGTMMPMDDFYVNKLAVSSHIKRSEDISITDPLEETITKVAKAINKDIEDVLVCMLNRSRHTEEIEIAREMGVKLQLIDYGDVLAAMEAGLPSYSVDLLYGIGGAPEAVLTAAALKCFDAEFQIQKVDTDTMEKDEKVYSLNDIVSGDTVFIATGITKGLLDEVKENEAAFTTHTWMLDSRDHKHYDLHTTHVK